MNQGPNYMKISYFQNTSPATLPKLIIPQISPTAKMSIKSIEENKILAAHFVLKYIHCINCECYQWTTSEETSRYIVLSMSPDI